MHRLKLTLHQIPRASDRTIPCPMIEADIQDLVDTASLRKPLTRASRFLLYCGLFSLLFSLGIIALLLLMGYSAFISIDNQYLLIAGAYLAIAGTYFLASWFAWHCQSWAIYLGLATSTGTIILIAWQLRSTVNDIYSFIQLILAAALPAFTAFFCARALHTLPQFLRRPAWTWQLLVYSRI